MKVLIFPPLKEGDGEVLMLRLTRRQSLKLQAQAKSLKVYGKEGGMPSVPALLRAIGEGEVLMVRRDAPVREPVVHRGCPVD
jgi:hypothetical protein